MPEGALSSAFWEGNRSLQRGVVNTSPGRWDDVGRTDKGAGPRKPREEHLTAAGGTEVWPTGGRGSFADCSGHHRAAHITPLRLKCLHSPRGGERGRRQLQGEPLLLLSILG